jgi:hypothetical protein
VTAQRSDEGSALMIAVIVMMLLTTVTLATLTRTAATLAYVRNGQNFDAALAAADAGLSLAVFRIENGRLTSWEEAGVAGAGSFRFYAQAVSDTEFVVSSKGRVGSAMHGLQAKVRRDALYPFALFAYQSINISGGTAGNLANFYLVGSVGTTVDVGSNSMLTCSGPSASNLRFRSAGGFSGCPASQWTELNPKQPLLDLEPAPSPSYACPIGGLFSGIVDGHNGVPYVCRQDVRFSGVVGVINGPLKVYVLNSLKADGSVNPTACHTLDIGSAVINAGSPARQVQLFKEGDCALDVGNGNTANQLTFSGVLYAPDTVLKITGGKWFTGSIMVGQVKVSGGPNLVIGYDTDLLTYYGQKWRVSRFGEVPSSSIAFPSGLRP